MNLISIAKPSLTTYLETESFEAQTTGKIICEEMNVEKRTRLTDALQKPEVHYFNIVVDSALTSMDETFETLSQVKSHDGVLLNFSTASQMTRESLKAHCTEVENTLSFRDDGDISGNDLAHKIQNLPANKSDNFDFNFEMLSFSVRKSQRKSILTLGAP